MVLLMNTMNTIKSARAHARGIAQALLLGALLLLYSGSGWTQAVSCYLADPAQNQNAQYQGKYLDSLCFFDMTGYDDQQASSAAGQLRARDWRQFIVYVEKGGPPITGGDSANFWRGTAGQYGL